MVVDFDPWSHARRTDPDTSLEAAFRIEDASEMEQRVYTIHLIYRPEGLTDETFLDHYGEIYGLNGRTGESKSSPRKRRSDLTRKGILVDSGERRTLRSGRPGVVWKIRE